MKVKGQSQHVPSMVAHPRKRVAWQPEKGPTRVPKLSSSHQDHVGRQVDHFNTRLESPGFDYDSPFGCRLPVFPGKASLRRVPGGDHRLSSEPELRILEEWVVGVG